MYDGRLAGVKIDDLADITRLSVPDAENNLVWMAEAATTADLASKRMDDLSPILINAAIM